MFDGHPSRLYPARTLCALVIFGTLFSILQPVPAQQRRKKAGRRVSPPARASVSIIPRPAVIESGTAEGDVYHSGDVQVRATTNTHMTIPIGMSKGAPVLVEFLADDPLYSFHEGNAKFAYVNCGQAPDGAANAQVPRLCSLRPTDPLVLQTGEQFVSPLPGSPIIIPSTVITVQRASGMVISFVIYPVPDPSKNANRVVVSYDLKEVLVARRKAGLMTQLVPGPELAEAGVPATSPLVTPPAGGVADSPAQVSGLHNPPEASAGNGQEINAPPLEPRRPEDVLAEQTVAELQRQAGNHSLLQFTKPVHGLQVAVLNSAPPVASTAIAVIALRNTLQVAVRLVPDQPELRITQSAKKGEAVLDQTLPVQHVATTVGDDNVLAPGAVYYFAIAYSPPALGVRQTLYVSFAHMLAADAPASAPLTFPLAAQ